MSAAAYPTADSPMAATASIAIGARGRRSGTTRSLGWSSVGGGGAGSTEPVPTRRRAAGTEAAVHAVESLDTTFVVPPAPWDKGGDFSWRWGLLHLIEEYARHAGHADIIRETIDGKGAFDLVFETGAMPEPDWSGQEGRE